MFNLISFYCASIDNQIDIYMISDKLKRILSTEKNYKKTFKCSNIHIKKSYTFKIHISLFKHFICVKQNVPKKPTLSAFSATFNMHLNKYS